jgi:hypothetical protein
LFASTRSFIGKVSFPDQNSVGADRCPFNYHLTQRLTGLRPLRDLFVQAQLLANHPIKIGCAMSLVKFSRHPIQLHFYLLGALRRRQQWQLHIGILTQLRNAFQAAIRAAGIPQQANGRTLRHRFATTFLENGSGRRRVQERLKQASAQEPPGGVEFSVLKCTNTIIKPPDSDIQRLGFEG